MSMNDIDLNFLSNSKIILEKFLNFSINNTKDVLNEFSKLPNAISHFDGGKNNFVYIPGSREDRVLLVAHADTVWDDFYMMNTKTKHIINYQQGIYSSGSDDIGIGADDRAGCAILWILKDIGHSLLILDGEEHGQIGSHHLKNKYPHIFKEINEHNYMIQFDRRGKNDYKTYNIPVTNEFIKFVEENTNYINAGKLSRTDIVVLCHKICGVNLSIGYYNEHTGNEILVFEEWLNTLIICYTLLLKSQKKFLLSK